MQEPQKVENDVLILCLQ